MNPAEIFPQLPEDWQLRQIKYQLLPGREGCRIGPFGSALKLDDLEEFGIPVFGQENVMAADYSRGKRFISEDRYQELSNYAVRAGDALVTMMGSAGRCDVVPAGTPKAIIDSHLLRLRFDPRRLSARFFRWYLDQSIAASAQSEIMSNGSIMAGLNSGIVKGMWIPVPPIPVQHAIAEFLDRKTAAIDALIEKKERMIELLAEKRTALVHRAVTKGLDPDVPMKDSGIPWIGEIPVHWDLIQLKRRIRLARGFDITKDSQAAGDIPVISSGGALSTHNVALMPGPGVVVGRKGSVGTIHWVDSDYWPHDTTLYVTDFGTSLPRFVYYKLFSIDLAGFDTGSANPTLNRNLIHPLHVSWPPRPEQDLITQELDNETRRIDCLQEKLGDTIQSLKEYRQALITQAVTGQLDIPDAA